MARAQKRHSLICNKITIIGYIPCWSNLNSQKFNAFLSFHLFKNPYDITLCMIQMMFSVRGIRNWVIFEPSILDVQMWWLLCEQHHMYYTHGIATFYLWKYPEFCNFIFGMGKSKYNSQNLITDLVS